MEATLDSNRYKDVKRVFQSAIELPPDERAGFVRRECGDDSELYGQVWRLLRSPGLETSIARAAIENIREATEELDTIVDEDASREVSPVDGSTERYEIVDKIGKGGMGVVYRAVDTSLDREVAIKFLPDEWAADHERMQHFRSEARTVASLNHPNIVVIYSIEEISSIPFMVMELVSGRTLRELLPNTGLPLRQLLEHAIPVADALAAVHANGITHRDLKPENVMIAHDGRVKVLDFGIAKKRMSSPELKTTGPAGVEAIAGTPSYMSPEQLQGRDTTPSSDVFSLGILLFELAVGKRPFSGETPNELAAAIISDEAAPVSAHVDVPASFDAIVSRCLNKEPSARPKTMAPVLDELIALRHDLERDTLRGFVANRAIGTHESSSGSGTERPRTVAVSPFQDLSPDADQRYFCVGIAEEIAAELSRVPELRVSITSRMDRDAVEPLEMGRILDVSAVIDGSVRRFGDQMRILVRLTRVSDGSVMWTSRFDRPIVDAFAVQDEVAQAVAKHFDAQLAPGRRQSPSDNPKAYAAYLRGRFFWGRRYEDGLKRALECFDEALEIDPMMAEAHAGRADCFVILGHYGYMDTIQAYDIARKSAERALEIFPDLAEAHATMGWILAFFDWCWENAKRSFERAHELDPNYATGWEWDGIHLLSRGKHDEALRALRRAQKLDPLSLMMNTILGWAHYEVGEEDEGKRIMEMVTRMDPRFVFASNVRGGMMAARGNASAGTDILERAVAVSGREGLTLSFLGFAYGRAGREGEANKVISEIEGAQSRQYVSPFHLALPHIGAGHTSIALDYLEKAVSQRDAFFASTHFSALFDTIREEPRFKAFLNTMGIATP